MFIFNAFVVSGVLILLSCGLVFCLKKTHGFWGYFLLGWALQVLLSLPAGIWQSITGWGFLTTSSWINKARLPLMGWPFNTAGFSIRWMLDLFGREILGDESAFLQYILLMLLQVTILAAVFAQRYKQRRTFADWVIICLGILFLINSLINVNWCWNVG